MDKTEPMKVGASVAVQALRDERSKYLSTVPRGSAHDALRAKREREWPAAVLKVRDECIPNLPDKWAIAIAKGDSTLRGWSHLGLTYHNAPDEIVGGYRPERDDSTADGWVQPVWWSDGKGGWKCGSDPAGRLMLAGDVDASDVAYGATATAGTVLDEPHDKVTRAAVPFVNDGTKVLAQDIADFVAAEPSTVFGSTVTVHDGAGNVLATATAPEEIVSLDELRGRYRKAFAEHGFGIVSDEFLDRFAKADHAEFERALEVLKLGKL